MATLKFQGQKHLAIWLHEHPTGKKILEREVSQALLRCPQKHLLVEVDSKTITVYGSRQNHVCVVRRPEMTTASDEKAWESVLAKLVPLPYVELLWPHATRDRPGRLLSASNSPVTMHEVCLSMDVAELSRVLGSELDGAETLRAMLVTR